MKAVIFDILGVLYKNGRILDEAYFVLEELRRKQLITACISNLAISTAQRVVQALELEPALIGAELGLFKPDKEIYKIFLERTGLKADDCLIIDDRQINLKPAKKLGMITVLLRKGDFLSKEKCADHQVEDLDCFLDLINKEYLAE